MGVAQAHELHPGKTILLDGVDDILFSQLISQQPFLFLRISGCLLAPGTEAAHCAASGVVTLRNSSCRLTKRAARWIGMRSGLSRGAGPLQNITHQYAAARRAGGAPRAPLRVDVADPLAADRSGRNGMAANRDSAGCRDRQPADAGDTAPGQKLYVTALCPTAQLAQGPLEMTLTVNGVRLPAVRFTKGDAATTFAFELRAPGAGDTDIRLEVGRTVRIGADRRDLGMAVVRLEIK